MIQIIAVMQTLIYLSFEVSGGWCRDGLQSTEKEDYSQAFSMFGMQL